jgi:hypothetical protein
LNLVPVGRDQLPIGARELGRSNRIDRGGLIMIRHITQASILALAVTATTAGIASARTPYDGRWSLSIVTKRGACDAYNFPVDISNGHVTFPGLNKASGRVSSGGSVRVFVSAMGKSASGSGRLSYGAGSGSWRGQSGSDRCSGTWTAQRG